MESIGDERPKEDGEELLGEGGDDPEDEAEMALLWDESPEGVAAKGMTWSGDVLQAPGGFAILRGRCAAGRAVARAL